MSVRPCLIIVLAVLVLAAPPPAQAQETGNVCVRDFQPGGLCTANDVRIQEVQLVALVEGCGDGTLGEAEAIFDVLVSAEGSPTRYDIGIFMALDGGSARDGDACYHDFLAPPLSGSPTFGDANGDGILDLDSAPWFAGDADQCGDISSNTQVLKPIPQLRFACTDSDDDGFVDAHVCPSWDNNAVTNCSGISDAFPGTNSKCGCTTVSLGIPLFSPAPAISVTKSPATQTVAAGEDANFTITVDNTGNVQLTGVTVVDPLCTTVTGPVSGDDGDNILQTTETWTYSCTTTGVAASFTNTATVSATPASGPPDVSDSDTADVVVTSPGPAMSVSKTPPNQTVSSGDTASFTIMVDNTGNVSLDNVVVADPQCTTLTGPDAGDDGDGVLETTETWSYTCMVTGVTAAFTNTATVTATPVSGPPDISDGDSADVAVTVPAAPAISASKTPASQTIAAGGDASFTIVVDNSGDTDLGGVVMLDPACTTLSGPTGDDGDGLLQTTETWIWSCTTTGVTAAFTNIATVTATPVSGGSPVSDTATAVVTVPLAVPTMSQGLFAVLAALLLAGGAFHLRRERARPVR